jgi:hypothetical protein
MWLSKQTGTRPEPPAPSALRGTVTLSGADVAAFTDAERRDVTVCTPGGYAWRPAVRDEVLVIKDAERHKSYLIAALSVSDPVLAPGEVRLYSGEAELRLTPDGGARLTSGRASIVMSPSGGIDLRGAVRVNGVPLVTGE